MIEDLPYKGLEFKRARAVSTQGTEVVITPHALSRMGERFGICPKDAEEVIRQTFREGMYLIDGEEIYVEHEEYYIIGVSVNEGRTIVVKTVLDSSTSLSPKHQELIAGMTSIHHGISTFTPHDQEAVLACG